VHSRDELADDFRRLGVAPGDVVMLHASVRAVGEVAGGPDQIHLALKDAVTPGGTLLMYASCPSYVDEVGRGNLTAAQEREILDKLPAFDAQTARAQRENGALVELLRTYPGSIVNDHVARFVGWGARAGELLLSQQPWNYAFGTGSALDRFLACDGRILLLGCDHDSVTFLHYAEHIVDIPDKIVARFKVPVTENGGRVWRDMEEFDTSERAHAAWPDRFFSHIVDSYLSRTGNTGNDVGDARSFLLDARGLLAFALNVMNAVARDPRAAKQI
jgi:aminoglycoside 3-N-acetyltransferase